jgi:hypothetical protein
MKSETIRGFGPVCIIENKYVLFYYLWSKFFQLSSHIVKHKFYIDMPRYFYVLSLDECQVYIYPIVLQFWNKTYDPNNSLYILNFISLWSISFKIWALMSIWHIDKNLATEYSFQNKLCKQVGSPQNQLNR